MSGSDSLKLSAGVRATPDASLAVKTVSHGSWSTVQPSTAASHRPAAQPRAAAPTASNSPVCASALAPCAQLARRSRLARCHRWALRDDWPSKGPQRDAQLCDSSRAWATSCSTPAPCACFVGATRAGWPRVRGWVRQAGARGCGHGQPGAPFGHQPSGSSGSGAGRYNTTPRRVRPGTASWVAMAARAGRQGACAARDGPSKTLLMGGG